MFNLLIAACICFYICRNNLVFIVISFFRNVKRYVLIKYKKKNVENYKNKNLSKITVTHVSIKSRILYIIKI